MYFCNVFCELQVESTGLHKINESEEAKKLLTVQLAEAQVYIFVRTYVRISQCSDRYVRMYVCMYVCMYVYMYVCMYVLCVCIYTCTTSQCLYLYVCVYVCMYVHMYVHVYVCMYACTGWRRLIGSPKLQIIFHKRATKYRSLLRKMTYKDKGSYESSPPCMYVWWDGRIAYGTASSSAGTFSFVSFSGLFCRSFLKVSFHQRKSLLKCRASWSAVIDARTYVQTSQCLNIYVHEYVCMYVWICMYVCAYICMYICMYVCMYARMYVCVKSQKDCWLC